MPERTQQINKLLKKELAILMAKEIDFSDNVLVTIEKVETLNDLSQANVLIEVFPEKSLCLALKILEKNCSKLHQGLNRRIKLRKIPKIRFKPEKQVAQELKIARLLDEIAKDDKME